MKTPEIEAIDYILKWIENVGVTYDMEVSCYEEEFKKIKQDLGVLEIIKIKNVNLYSIKGFLNMRKKYSMSLEDVLKAYNLNYPKLTLEELQKLKQWLEENENE
jgi:hypothetical protein